MLWGRRQSRGSFRPEPPGPKAARLASDSPAVHVSYTTHSCLLPLPPQQRREQPGCRAAPVPLPPPTADSEDTGGEGPRARQTTSRLGAHPQSGRHRMRKRHPAPAGDGYVFTNRCFVPGPVHTLPCSPYKRVQSYTKTRWLRTVANKDELTPFLWVGRLPPERAGRRPGSWGAPTQAARDQGSPVVCS